MTFRTIGELAEKIVADIADKRIDDINLNALGAARPRGRLQQVVGQVSRLGSRPMYEVLAELCARHVDLEEDIIATCERFSWVPPAAYFAVGAGEFPAVVAVIEGGRR